MICFFDLTLARRWGYHELAAHSTRTEITQYIHILLAWHGGTTIWRSTAILLLRMGIMSYRM